MTLGSCGWTVIQRRQDGSEDFYRSWTDYKSGFGNLSGEFWLGLDKIHRLTNSGQNVLLINMTTKNNDQSVYAEYENFFVSDESEQYKLDVGNYSGMHFICFAMMMDNLFMDQNLCEIIYRNFAQMHYLSSCKEIVI